MKETEAAFRALGSAIETLGSLTIHMRDFYVQEDGQKKWEELRDWRGGNLVRLHALQDEVLQLHENIQEQGR